jgi:hypothetical protein
MTIRGYLQRRWIRSWLALIVLGAIFGISMEFVAKSGALWNFLRLFAAIVFIWTNWNLYRTPCPNCSKPLGTTAFFIVSGVGAMTYKCPHCGISLDKQMPGSG